MGTNAVEAYAGLHLDFVTIRPFFDGNGRVARLIANLPFYAQVSRLLWYPQKPVRNIKDRYPTIKPPFLNWRG